MHYGRIKTFDVANGEGIRVSIFVSGCRNHCPECFNEETWEFEFGTPFTSSTVNSIIRELMPKKVRGLSILGGEPLEPENQHGILHLVSRVKGEYPEKTIWLYTGFTWEELHDNNCRAHTSLLPHILEQVDVLVDGRFESDKKDLRLRFRGSTNQRIIDVQESLKKSEVILYKLEDK